MTTPSRSARRTAIRADILALERETEGLPGEIVGTQSVKNQGCIE